MDVNRLKEGLEMEGRGEVVRDGPSLPHVNFSDVINFNNSCSLGELGAFTTAELMMLEIFFELNLGQSSLNM